MMDLWLVGVVSSGSWGTMREARWRRSWCSGGEFMVAGKEAMLCFGVESSAYLATEPLILKILLSNVEKNIMSFK